MRRARSATIYDSLRIELSRNGAIKSPSPQSERPVAAASFRAGMDTSGIGQAATTARSSRTFTGGAIAPQGFLSRQPAGFEDVASDAGKLANTPTNLPNRGLSPKPAGDRPAQRADFRRRSTPLAKRR